MELHRESSLLQSPSSDLLILPFWETKGKAKLACAMKGFESLYGFPVSQKDFQGKEKETLLLYKKNNKEMRVLLLGLGSKDKVHAESIRQSYAEALKICHKKGLVHIALAIPECSVSAALSAIEGILLTNYTFNRFKTSSPEEIVLTKRVDLLGIDQAALEECREAQTIISSVNFVRDLVNGNADEVTPQMLAKTAQELGKISPLLKTRILEKEELEKIGMGLLLAVGKGSVHPPLFITVEYCGNPKSSKKTAIIGKGVTYDTGGLNIKPTGSMETMKTDMSGAATVLGTLRAAAELRLQVNLIGIVAAAENSIGPNSYKPGDVYKSYSGKSIEISNTDAEGRLIYADALSYVQEHYQPSQIIGFATLTGGIVVALGEEASGLFCNDECLVHSLLKAGERTHERLWRMPIYREYKEHLKSLIADMKNCGDRKASSSVAAVFLHQFIQEELPWAHIDIAGTAFLSAPRHYHLTSATGVGVRLLIDFFKNEKAV